MTNGRFIPAGAGNTPYRPGVHDERAVHPRGRGEHISTRSLGLCSSGSSPRARGTLTPCLRHTCLIRFIPAGAGNTSFPSGIPHNIFGSSPRARGTRQVCPSASPRARGTHNSWHPKVGFIPAGAGNTKHQLGRDRRRSVHPRGRGEHPGKPTHLRFCSGSSPRARGTRGTCPIRTPLQRFIPAGAGNTECRAYVAQTYVVHPRGRGEHGDPGSGLGIELGSSPRARGTQPVFCRSRRRRRFIPAGAGNTERALLRRPL